METVMSYVISRLVETEIILVVVWYFVSIKKIQWNLKEFSYFDFQPIESIEKSRESEERCI